MNSSANLSDLSLGEALTRWCDPELVNAVRGAESFFAEIELRDKHWFHLGGAQGLLAKQRLRDSGERFHAQKD